MREDAEAMWQLVENGWIYIVQDESRARKCLAAMLVHDLAKHLAALSARGISVPEMDVMPGLYKKVVLNDADGNAITIGEALSGDPVEDGG